MVGSPVLEMLGSRGVSVNEIGPVCLAPSHPLHVMPSRRTRDSHRPRASHRTMVAMKHHLACCSLNSTAASLSAEKLTTMDQPNFSREIKLQWAGSRERNLGSGRERTFFLTSLFIELVDRLFRPSHNTKGSKPEPFPPWPATPRASAVLFHRPSRTRAPRHSRRNLYSSRCA